MSCDGLGGEAEVLVVMMVVEVVGAVDLQMFQASGSPVRALDRSDRQLKESVHGLQLTPAAVNKGMLEWRKADP